MEQIQSSPMGKQVQMTLRFPEEWIENIDAIAKAMSRPGNEASRTDALRYILTKGMEPAERELGIKPAKKPATK